MSLLLFFFTVVTIYLWFDSLVEWGLLVQDIKGLLSLFRRGVVYVVPKTEGLAKFALNVEDESVWLEDIPSPVRAVAHANALVDVE